MKRLATSILPGLLFLCLVCPNLCADQTFSNQDQHFSSLIQKIKPAIVAMGTFYFNDVPKNQYLGTGFVISGGKRVVTNYHVIQPVIKKEKQAYLRIFHKNIDKKGIKAKILAVDEFHDLAILEQTGQPLPSLVLSDSDTAKEGHKVAFTGYPLGLVLGLNPTTHTGIISAIAPLIKPSPTARIIDGKLLKHLKEPYEIFQIDATAYPGNSGSPVYKVSTGEVIAVINQVFVKGKKEHAITDPSGITYAIPARFVLELEKTIKPKQ